MNALIAQLLVLQLAVPLALIVANALIVPATLSGLALRFLGIALVLIYTGVAGVWLFPPWWTPYALGLLHLVGTFVAYRRLTRSQDGTGRMHRLGEWLVSGLAIAAVASPLASAIEARSVPDTVVDLAAPLESGRYLVTSGGTSASINAHLVPLPAERASDYRGQNYAVDLIAVDVLGLRADGIAPRDPRKYRIYGRRVLAPCTGRVAGTGDGMADMPVPEMDREQLLGNHVILDCDGQYVVLAHLAPGSVAVSESDEVDVGTPIGQVGNTGKTAEPHLHLHVQDALPDNTPIAAEPLWFTIEGHFPLRGQRLAL